MSKGYEGPTVSLAMLPAARLLIIASRIVC